MCDDMDFGDSVDVSDSSGLDDVGSDFSDVDSGVEMEAVSDLSFDADDSFELDDISDDFSNEGFDLDINDVSDESFDVVDSDSDFDLEMIDISDDDGLSADEEIETLDFDESIEASDEIETLELDDNSDTLEIDNLETSEINDLEDDLETLDIDDFDETVEAFEIDDTIDDISEDFETTEEIEELDIDDVDFSVDEVSDDIETVDFDDNTSNGDIDDMELFEDTKPESEDLENGEILESDFEDESIDAETEINNENLEGDGYQAIPISEIPIVDENGNIDTLENIIDENNNEEVIDTSEVEPYEARSIEDASIEEVNSDTESYEAIPISEIPIVQEDGSIDSLENIMNEQSEITDEAVEQNEITNEDEFIVDDSEIEQALRDDAVDNAPLTDTVYEDDNELNESGESEIPHMTDEELEAFVNWEHQQENGNYDLINDIMNDDSLTDDQKEFMTQQLLDEIEEGENEVIEYGQRVKGLTYDGRDIVTKPEEYELTDEDLNSVYEGLESYDFQGVDCFEDIERLDSSLMNFTNENWEQLSLDEQKESMTDLAQYIIDVTGLENPPTIEFYNNEVEGDYGGFNRATNTLSINEHMLYQNDEAADTVAHELWHALQYQRASNPQTRQDLMYAENFADYITPEEDFEGYQSQILESEARAFAQQIKDRLHSY